jgi:hypothetical protein
LHRLRLIPALVAGALVIAGAPAAGAARADIRNGSVYAEVTDTGITLGNSVVERRWAREGFGTTRLERKGRFVDEGDPAPDFRLFAGPVEIESSQFDVLDVTVTKIPRGLRLELELGLPGVMNVTRSVEAYNGIAGFRTETTILSNVPLPLRGYTLDELRVPGAAPTIHAFRAGADWREPDWDGPDLAIGEEHGGTWRETTTKASGESLEGPAQWITLDNDGTKAFMVMERNDFPSSRASYDGTTAALVVDHSADIVSTGPFEENIHAENPQPGYAGRVRTITPFDPFELEAAFTGLALDHADEAWQFHKYLTRERLNPYAHDITFNSNGTDGNVISTGAKDDMNFAMVQQVAPIAKDLGIETFILDDGWQARSGDWFPDCPDHPEPRFEQDPVKFAPRFPDCDFTAVREAIAPMKLGLWMNPMHFHPTAQADDDHPEWICQPIGSGLFLVNSLDQTGSSNEAGISQWGPDVIPHIEGRIRVMIEEWEVMYFKFDFLVWLDCAGQGDLYEFKEAFVAMLDRLIADYDDVTFSIDETNDYRLFPFESVMRGPSWFQNGSPPPHQLLHNIWNLSPWIPAKYVGQHFLGGGQFNNYPVDTLMAIALPSHMTFFSDLRNLPSAVIDQAQPWTAFYRENREAFTQIVYPLLDDPMDRKWTALQSWNPEDAFGALLAFRQDSDESSKTIALTNVPEGHTFDLIEAPTGNVIGSVTSQQLADGITIELPEKNTAKVFVIRSHPEGIKS